MTLWASLMVPTKNWEKNGTGTPFAMRNRLTIDSGSPSYLIFHGIQCLASQVTAQEPQSYPSYKAQHHLAAMLGEDSLAAEMEDGGRATEDRGWAGGRKTYGRSRQTMMALASRISYEDTVDRMDGWSTSELWFRRTKHTRKAARQAGNRGAVSTKHAPAARKLLLEWRAEALCAPIAVYCALLWPTLTTFMMQFDVR